MQVFNAFLKIIRKNIRTALIYIIIFFGMCFLMASNSEEKQSFKSTKLTVSVFDEDNTEESRALTAFIGQKHNLKTIENDPDVIKDAVYMQMISSVDYVMVIQKGYAEKLNAHEYNDLFGNYHMHDDYDTAIMEQFLNEYVSSVRAYQASGKSLTDAISRTESALSVETKVTIKDFTNHAGSDEFPALFSNYFRYLPYILVSVLIEVLCPVLLAMGRKKIRYRTNCSSVKPMNYTLQLFAGSALFVAVIWLAFMIGGMAFYGGIYRGIAWIAVLNSFIFAMISVTLAVLIAAFNPSETIVNLVAQVIGLGMSFLCGIFIEQQWLSSGVLAFAKFLPAYWYVKVNNMIAGIDAYDSKAVIFALLIETAFAVALALLTIAVRKAKYSSKKQIA